MICKAKDGLILKGACWHEEKKPAEAVLIIVHGMLEHIKRYEKAAAFFAEHGIRVYAFDLRGHGTTAPDEENRGFFANTNGVELLLSDMDSMIATVLEDLSASGLSELPRFLLGHSMGSFITSCYLKNRTSVPLTGVILSGTTARPGPVGIVKNLARAQCAVFGEKSKGRLLTKIAFGSYNKRIPNVRTANDWLTRDEGIVDAYNADPACTFVFKAAGFADLFSLLSEIGPKDWTGAVSDTLRILIMSGSMDPVGAYGKGPEILYEWFRGSGHDVTLKLYPEGRHEMLNELNGSEVMEDIRQFILSVPNGNT
jgi:alpha-beta hydrolase superfamily lysophospholipase